MSEALIKAMKWCFLVVLAIGGIYGLAEAGEQEDFRYIMITVLTFGAISLMFRNWRDLPGKIMAFSGVLAFSLAFLANDSFAPYAYYSLTGNMLDLGYYQIWALLVCSVGYLVMAFVFWKFDD